MTLDPPSGEPSNDSAVLTSRANERVRDKMRILEFILERELSTGESNLICWEPRCLAWYAHCVIMCCAYLHDTLSTKCKDR